MATRCAHCGAVAHTRTSRMVSATTQEEYFQCSNIKCGHTFKAVREHVETLSPSAIPNPAVHLPQASRAQLAAMRLAEKRELDRDQLTLDLPG